MNAVIDTPYWWEEAEPEPAGDGAPPADADVVIVGAGFTGLGAAIPLARAGRRVTILERDRPGDGASSRNGGIASGNIRWSFPDLIAKHGMEAAKAFYAEGVAAREDLKHFVEAEKIDCDYRACGRFMGAMTPDEMDGIKREADMMHRHIGIETRIVERTEQHREIGSTLYHGGTVRPDIGGLHPAKLHRGLRRIAEAAGVTIIGGSGVLGIERKGGAFQVRTAKGTVRAAHVIVATNGYTDKGLPWLRRRVVPVISEMIATEPLGDNLMRTLMPKLQMHSETRHLGHYYRPSPDGTRILLGGRRYHSDAAAARERLREGLVEIFPDLRDARLTHHWFGYVAFPLDQLPKLAVDNGIVYAAGFCGSGVVWARWLGQKAAMVVMGRDGAESAFAGQPFRAIPLYDGTPWFLPAMMAWYRLRDRLGGR